VRAFVDNADRSAADRDALIATLVHAELDRLQGAMSEGGVWALAAAALPLSGSIFGVVTKYTEYCPDDVLLLVDADGKMPLPERGYLVEDSWDPAVDTPVDPHRQWQTLAGTPRLPISEVVVGTEHFGDCKAVPGQPHSGDCEDSSTAQQSAAVEFGEYPWHYANDLLELQRTVLVPFLAPVTIMLTARNMSAGTTTHSRPRDGGCGDEDARSDITGHMAAALVPRHMLRLGTNASERRRATAAVEATARSARAIFQRHFGAEALAQPADDDQKHHQERPVGVALLEGTVLSDCMYGQDPRAAAAEALEASLRKDAGRSGVSLGLDADSHMCYAPYPGASRKEKFYDGVVTVAGPELLRNGVGRAAIVAMEDGEERLSVPMEVFLDEKEWVRRHAHVVAVETINASPAYDVLASVANLLPARAAFPPPVDDDEGHIGVSAGHGGGNAARRSPQGLVARMAALVNAAKQGRAKHAGTLELLPFHFRSDRVTEAWAEQLMDALIRARAVQSVASYAERVPGNIDGLVVVISVRV
jgi:hypothetical protein